MIVPPLMSDDIVPHMGCCITISPTPCADPTLNIKNLCQVMASVMEWYDLGNYGGGLNVPTAVREAIRDNPAYKTVEEKREALLLYYLQCTSSLLAACCRSTALQRGGDSIAGCRGLPEIHPSW